MKTYQPLKWICALLLIITVTVSAGTPKRTDVPAGNSNTTTTVAEDLVEKKKTINRSYTVSSSDKLDIENSFGTVNIKTWNKSEFKVDVTITVKAKDDAEAQRLLNGIEIKEDKGNGVYSFKTKVEMNDKRGDKEGNDNHREHRGEDRREFTIDFDVYMPATNPLDVANSFGKLIIADFDGKATITSKFGELIAGKITNNNGVSSEFGSAKIASINSGKVTVKFGEATIGSLGGDAKVVCEYAETKFGLSSDFTGLNVINSFGSTRIDLPSGFNASLSADCSFGELTNKTSFTLKEVRDDDNRYSMDKHYEGGSGSAKVKIKSNFGEVRLMNPGDKDEPQKGKHKNKDKDKDKDKDDDV